MKHNTLTKIITLALAVVLALSLAACGSKTNTDGDQPAATIKIGVPNDTTNEARALLLLQENGIIKLKDGVGITATRTTSWTIPTTWRSWRPRPPSCPICCPIWTTP